MVVGKKYSCEYVQQHPSLPSPGGMLWHSSSKHSNSGWEYVRDTGHRTWIEACNMCCVIWTVTWCMCSIIVINKLLNLNVCTGDCLFGQINVSIICLACYIFCMSIRYPLLKVSLLWLDWTQQIFYMWNWSIKLLFRGNWFCLVQSGLWLYCSSFLSHSNNDITLAQKCMH